MSWKKIISQRVRRQVFDPATQSLVWEADPTYTPEDPTPPQGYRRSKPKGLAGRVCKGEGCTTVLSIYNPKDLCAVCDPEKGNKI